MADFREYLAKAEESLAETKAELEASIKKAKEAELSFLNKKAELKDREDKVKAHEKEVDVKLAKLAKLEIVERDEKKMVEREMEIEKKEKLAQKAVDDAATMKLQAEQALQSAKDVVAKANKEKSEIEANILKKFKDMVIGG